MIKKSKFKVNVGEKSKIIIDWRDKPENYSNESKKHIISIASDRYSVPKESVKVVFTPLRYNEKGEKIDVSTDVINNIQDPKFQVKLFNDYIAENNIKDIDFEYIKKIDSEINSKIDYDVYDKYRKYEIEWMEWDYFLSYGPNNRFDFKSLSGLTLVNGYPGNMSGKTTLTQDVISFLLFGKPQKPYTLSECFNKFSDSKFFRVAGAIKVDGESYIIERVVTRGKKRTGGWGDASQEVKYYKVINGDKEEISDYNKNSADEHSLKTNKVIKEAIGSEKDFNMIISATANDLDSLIDVGSTERGRLLSKWIGLFPLEEKDKLAKNAFKDFERPLKSKMYNETDLTNENEAINIRIGENEELLKSSNSRLDQIEKELESESLIKSGLLSSKKIIDETILKLDINSVNVKMKSIENDANIKKQQLEKIKSEFETVKDIVFDNEVYKNELKNESSYTIEINGIKSQINTLKETNKHLCESEFCPTCKRKYDGTDNSAEVASNDQKINALIEKGTSSKANLDKTRILIKNLEDDKIKYDQKLKLENLLQIIPVQIENLRSQYRDLVQKLKDYENNKLAIDSNNQIDIALTNTNAKINALGIEKTSKIRDIENLKRNIQDQNNTISKNNIIIEEIKSEYIKIRSWNAYLEMVGKNGVSKMVLRKTLPIINSELSRLLDDVCDFEIEVVLTDKNEVMFNIIKDGVSSNLSGASGFERTASSLALRCVLGNISTMPRPNFITLDEILGKVARENYDNMRSLYSKIEKNYQFILHISHLEEIKDWHKGIISVSKENNISSIKIM